MYFINCAVIKCVEMVFLCIKQTECIQVWTFFVLFWRYHELPNLIKNKDNWMDVLKMYQYCYGGVSVLLPVIWQLKFSFLYLKTFDKLCLYLVCLFLWQLDITDYSIQNIVTVNIKENNKYFNAVKKGDLCKNSVGKRSCDKLTADNHQCKVNKSE